MASTSTDAPALRVRWRSPPACHSCGAARVAAACTECKRSFCAPCARNGAVADLSNGCGSCGALCSECKPISCGFCESYAERPPRGMCEACSECCNGCKAPACGMCWGTFEKCGACGFAACEGCWMQGMKLTCWCSRAASDCERPIGAQRYEMAQLHPSVRSCSFDACGLADGLDNETEQLMADEAAYGMQPGYGGQSGYGMRASLTGPFDSAVGWGARARAAGALRVASQHGRRSHTH